MQNFRKIFNDSIIKKIFIKSVSQKCDNNFYLVEKLNNFFKFNNYEIVNDAFIADVIILSTCGFCNYTEKLSIKIIEDYKEKYKNKKIIITGCLPKINPEVIKKMDLIPVGFAEMDKFNILFKSRKKIENVESNILGKYYLDKINNDKYFVHICRGCVNNCSYCVIKWAKGYVKSKPIKKIIQEINTGVKLGYKKIVLLSDDGGSYGIDINSSLSELIMKIINLPKKNFKLIIQNIHPQAMINLFSKVPKEVFKRFYSINIPVQSLTSRILSLMNRKYDVDKVLEIAKHLKDINPDIHLRTEVIYGFPSEKRKEFYKNFQLANYFDAVIFRNFSIRKGTKAAEYKNKIGIKELEFRTNKLIDKFEEMPALQLASKYEAIFHKKHPKLK